MVVSVRYLSVAFLVLILLSLSSYKEHTYLPVLYVRVSHMSHISYKIRFQSSELIAKDGK